MGHDSVKGARDLGRSTMPIFPYLNSLTFVSLNDNKQHGFTVKNQLKLKRPRVFLFVFGTFKSYD